MTAYSEKQKTLSCFEINELFEKFVLEDGLFLDEQQQLDIHLNQCTSCRRLFRMTSGLSVFAESNAEGRFDAAIADIMEDLRLSREEKQSPRTGWKTYAIAAAIAAVTIVGVWNLRSLFQPDAAPSPAAQCTPMSPVETATGVFMTYCDGSRPEVSIENGEVTVSLRRGSVALFVDPERPAKKKVVVETLFGEVRVKGTIFTVRVDGANAWVEVVRGTVEVVPVRDETPAFFVTEGYGSELKRRAPFRVSKPNTDALTRALPVKPSGAPDGEPGESIRARQVSPDSRRARVEVKIGAETDPIDNSALIEKEIHNSIHNGASRLAASSMKTLIEEARSCLLARNWSCAASRYQEALRINAGRPGLTTVLITLAKIELRHLNSPKKALAHYGTYLRQAPNGPLAEEALLGMAHSYRRLGLEDREAETLQRYIERYPKSGLLGKARSRLEQLIGSTAL